ncbi:MAG TPA: serine/threonine protein kinase [Verrucomicrobiae bacterium]|nr:serine/threonine protein kinase [Verrucomicrobiae bacterium]
MNQHHPTHSRSSGVASFLARTGRFLRTQLWVWPVVAVLVLVFTSVTLRVKMENATKQQIAGTLETILNANVEALRSWSVAMKSDAQNIAEDKRVGELVSALEQQAQSSPQAQAALLTSPQLLALREHLSPILERSGFSGFVVVNTNFLVLASDRDQIVGLQIPPEYANQMSPCLDGKVMVTRPFASRTMLPDQQGSLRVAVPTMFAVAPVRAANGRIVAVLGLRIAPETDFTRILATARAGKTGETYAFSHDGELLSESRFDPDLKRLGLIPDNDDARSILSLDLRDPLVDLEKGRKPPQRHSELPFTHAVAEAINGQSGVDVAGYRDYRGVPVVGAWTWLGDFDMGLVTEMDQAEAFRPLHILRVGFWSIFSLLVVGAMLVYFMMHLASRLQSVAQKASLQAKQLGQYALDDKIGEGMFGSVYRAHHALMRRPVAVKLLQTEKMNPNTAARFEREVQMTSQLTHPNTIALYDYGHTPEGVFYYAMEYLDGLTLDQLVKQYGPQPEGRVISILRQIAGSLAEAHAIGLVHRDIKPANVFLTQRGGLPDFVKVLDFGLAKVRAEQGQLELTTADTAIGTPLYMSPEAVEHPEKVDARSDLYSLGALGYFLLTGEFLFNCPTLGEVFLRQVHEMPERPSERMGRPVAADLEDLLMRCLAKKPASRPANARELEAALARCRNAGDWTRDTADEWWRKFAAAHAEKTVVTQSPPPTK